VVYEERNTWVGLIISVIGVAIYIGVVAAQAASRPIAEVDWVPAMLWTIGGAIVVSIAVSIAWGIAAGLSDREGVGRSDQRDRDIAHMGSRVGQAFLVIAGLGAIVLCAVEADWFWIANVLFFGFALSAMVGGVARVIAYRRGLD
jgi:hypothetical protein